MPHSWLIVWLLETNIGTCNTASSPLHSRRRSSADIAAMPPPYWTSMNDRQLSSLGDQRAVIPDRPTSRSLVPAVYAIAAWNSNGGSGYLRAAASMTGLRAHRRRSIHQELPRAQQQGSYQTGIFQKLCENMIHSRQPILRMKSAWYPSVNAQCRLRADAGTETFAPQCRPLSVFQNF